VNFPSSGRRGDVFAHADYLEVPHRWNDLLDLDVIAKTGVSKTKVLRQLEGRVGAGR
jgi:hypothetical protein